MKRYFIQFCTLIALSAGLFACEKEYGDNLGPLQDSVADIPVTVTNSDFFERYPGVNTSVAAGGKIEIQLSIPADKGTIKQITKVATGPATLANYGNLNSKSATTAYNVAALPGNGSNTITFTTSLDKYLPYRVRVGTSAGPIGPNVGTPPVATAPVPSITATPTDIGFYFLIELEDGSILVPRPVRVRVIP